MKFPIIKIQIRRFYRFIRLLIGLDKKIKFDSEQKYYGLNKYDHFQFGKFTCPFCKSDDTEPDKDRPLTHRKCQIPPCGGVFHV